MSNSFVRLVALHYQASCTPCTCPADPVTRQTLSMILFHGWAGASSALNMDSTAPPSLVVSYSLDGQIIGCRGQGSLRCFTRRKPPLLASWRHQYISWSPISWARHHCWLIDKKRQGCGVIGCVSKTLQVAGADAKSTGKELGQKDFRDRVFCLVSRLFCISLTNC